MRKIVMLLLVSSVIVLQACNNEGRIREDLRAVLEEISVAETTDGDVSLPDSVEGHAIDWSVDDDTYISTTGEITRPDVDTGDVSVVLTATISEDGIVESKDFALTILSWSEAETLAAMQDAADGFDVGPEIDEDITLPETLAGFNAAWSVDDDSHLDATGALQRPRFVEGDQEATLILTLDEGSVSDTFTFELTLLAFTETEALDNPETTLVPDKTDKNLLLPDTLGDREARWSIDNEDRLTADNHLVAPGPEEDDVQVVLTLELFEGTETQTVEFTIELLSRSADSIADEIDKHVAELSIPAELDQSMQLPLTAGGYEIEWSIDDETYLDEYNKLHRPEPGDGDQDVIITANIAAYGHEVEKTFQVTLLAYGEEEIRETLQDALAEVEIDQETTSSIDLPEYVDTFSAHWSVSDDTHLDSSGNLERPTACEGDQDVILTLKLEWNGIEETRDFPITLVAFSQETMREALEEAIAKVEIEDEITSSIELPRLVGTFAADWGVSDDTHLDRFGNLDRPSPAEGDQEITLTVTLKWGEMQETRDFSVTILAKTETEITETLETALAMLEIGETIDTPFYLPGTVDGFAVEWSMTPDHHLGDDNRVNRPGAEEGDIDATLVATVENKGVQAERSFDILLVAYTEDEEAAGDAFQDAMAAIDWVGTVVSEDLILPTDVDDVSIRWSSTDKATVSDSGLINPPLHRTGDLEVFMEARMSYEGHHETFRLPVTVEALPALDISHVHTLDFINLAEEYLLEDTELSVYYTENQGLPYIDVLEFLELLDGGEKDGAIVFRVLDIEMDGDLLIIDNRVVYDSDLYEDTVYTFIIDFENNHALTNQYGFFTSFQQATQTDFGQDLNVIDFEQHVLDAVLFDFEHYRMNIFRHDDNYLMPLHLANLFFSGSMFDVYYNGDTVYGFDTYQRNDEEIQETLLDSPYAGRDMTENMLFSTYNFLVFSFDHFYGLREDQGVETYYDVFDPDEIKTQGDDHYYALLELTLDLDDLHTSFGMTGHYAPGFDPYPLDIMQLGRRSRTFYFRLWDIQDDYLADKRHREDSTILDADSVVYYDDGRVARIPVSAFDDTMPEKFGSVMDIIDEKGTVEKIIVDLTYNTGGIVGTMIQILGYMTDEPIPMHRRNAGDGSMSTWWYTSDVEAREDYEWHIMSSMITYSAGNMMVQVAQEMGIATIIGVDSAGGAASITTNILPSGGIIIMSSPNVSANADYESIEYGIEVDIELDFWMGELLDEDAILEALEEAQDLD